MAFWILTNTVGETATSINSSPATASEYDISDPISGDRIRKHECAASADNHQYEYTCPSTAVTHCVVQDMDIFKRSLYGSQVKLDYDNSGWTTDSTTAVGSLDLVGPKSQDWVKTISQTSTKFRVNFENSASDNSAFRYGRVFFSNGFDMGHFPEVGSRSRLIRENENNEFHAIRGRAKYPCERTFSLIWQGVTTAKLKAFRALPLHAPMFLYDDAADLWPHKLEHVIISQDGWTDSRAGLEYHTLEIKFLRLKHYRS